MQEFHDIAKKTIEILTNNMIIGDASLDKIFEFYLEVTRENVIKLLLRCKKMYEARADVKKLILMIIKKDDPLSSNIHKILDLKRGSLKLTESDKE